MATASAFWGYGSLESSLSMPWHKWETQGLFIHFLAPYCSEMNLIEGEWHQLKTHEIAGQMFDNEYDLALAVIQGMESRSQSGEYTVERFTFNCT
jgi:putative transposase